MNTKLATKTNLVILAAVGVAVLASPVMAETWRDYSTHNVFSGEEGHSHTGRLTPGVVVGGAPPRIDDCVHVAFPQCAGGN